MTPEKLKQMRSASYLLPEPGDAVVRECLDEIERLRAALKDIAYPLDRIRQEAKEQGMVVEGMMAASIVKDPHFFRDKAINALQG